MSAHNVVTSPGGPANNTPGFRRGLPANRTARSVITPFTPSLYRPPENADRRAARVTREQFKENQRLFYPIEEELVDRSQQDPEAEAARAADLAGRGFDRGRAIFEQDLRDQGAVLTPEMRRTLDRKRGFLRSLAVGDAANRTRRSVKDRNEALLADLVGFSRGIRRSAADGIQDAADLEDGRRRAGQALRQQRRGQQISGLGTAAGLAMTGNPWLAGAVAIGSFL